MIIGTVTVSHLPVWSHTIKHTWSAPVCPAVGVKVRHTLWVVLFTVGVPMLPLVGAPQTVTVCVSPVSGSLMSPQTVAGLSDGVTIGGITGTGGLVAITVCITELEVFTDCVQPNGIALFLEVKAMV
jgi:hypothetical protein